MRHLAITFGLVALAGVLGCVPMRNRKTAARPSLDVTGAGRKLTQLTRDPAPEWSPALAPDGSQLLYARTGLDRLGNRTEQVIAGIDPNRASGEKVFTSATAISQHPAFDPTGKYLYMVSNTTGGLAIVRTSPASGGAALRVIVPHTEAESLGFPNITPDGKSVVFAAQMNRIWKIVRKEMDSPGLTVLGEGTQPSLSPDGKTVAFVRGVNGWNQIFIMDAETGGDLTQLTKVENYAVAPTWSPDGKRLAFCSDMGWNATPGGTAAFTRNVYAMDVNGAGVTQLTTGKGQVDWPTWGRDGFIYFQYAEEPTRAAWNNTDVWRLEPVLDAE